MKMYKVSHFEIPADDLERAQRFYREVFGWSYKKYDDDYVMATTIKTDKDGVPLEMGGINGGIQRRSERAMTPTVVIVVDSIDKMLKQIEIEGGMVAFPKMALENEGFYAQFFDTEGNRIGLFQMMNKVEK